MLFLLGTLALGLTTFTLALRAFWPFTVDDAFINLRYGRNLLEGHGPVFNVGERAEGYTSFAWMLAAAAAHALPGAPEAWMKSASLLAALAAIGLAAALAAEVAQPRGALARWRAATFTAALLLVYPGTAVHAVAGLETSLYAAACGALWLLSVRLLRRGGRTGADGALFALTSLALGLVRPDGNLVACVTATAVLFVSPRPARAGLLRHLTALYVLPGAAYFAWRWIYYGHPLPLPFYVKAEHTAPLAGLDEGVAFLADLLWRGVPIGLLALVGAASQPRRAAAPLAASGALFAFYLVPAPLMAYDHRYLHPIVFAAAALAGCGVSELGARLDTRLARRRGWGPGRFEGLAFACLIAALPVTFLAHLSTSVADKVSYATGLEKAHLTLGRRLAALDEHGGGSRRVALLDAGAVPYASRWTTIDTFGLNEPRIARSGRHDAAYVLDRSPDVLVTISSRRDRFEAVFDFEAELQREARGRGYVPVDVLTFVPGYELWVMARGPIAFKDERPGRHP